MLCNKCHKCKTDQTWETFCMQRNRVRMLKRNSIHLYFDKHYGKPGNSKQFWDLIKPFLTDKGSKKNDNIILHEADKIVIKPEEVCTIFNELFCNVASEIVFDDSIPNLGDNDELFEEIIRKHNIPNKEVYFLKISEREVYIILSTLDTNKSCGHDNVSAEILKISTEHIAPKTATMIDQCIDYFVFPLPLKYAEVSAIFKKKDNLSKENYRPISVLLMLSKVLEKVFATHISTYFSDIFSIYLSAYTVRHGWIDVLSKLDDAWKKDLDDNEYTGAMLMDLSKAFDCLPQCLLIAKLH